jgi:hypothetical protein
MKLLKCLKTGLLLTTFTALEAATFSFFHNTPALAAAPSCSRPTNMVGWWEFDEVVGTSAVDKTGNNNHGTYNGSLFPSAPPGDGLLKFDGVDDYISVPSAGTLNVGTGNFTVCFNIKTTSTSNVVETILDKRVESSGPVITGLHVYTYGGKVAMQLGDGSTYQNYVSTTSIADGNWHSVIISVTRNSATGGKMYVDGNLQYTFNPTSVQGNITNTTALTIGKRSATTTTATSYFKNSFDDLVILKTAL